MLTADEWEYLCGAGATTLFRWGDHMPRSRSFECHKRANRLGVVIADDTYHHELVAEPDVLRGGDGGGTVCGGEPWFCQWLPLASSFDDEPSCRADPTEPFSAGYTFARRVVRLG